jgi:hypothetical protein
MDRSAVRFPFGGFARSQKAMSRAGAICRRPVSFFWIACRFVASVGFRPSGLRASVSGLQASAASVGFRLSGLLAPASSLQASVSGLRVSVSGLHVSVSGLRASASHLRASVSCLRASASRLRASVSGLRASVSRLRASVSGLRASVASAGFRLSDLPTPTPTPTPTSRGPRARLCLALRPQYWGTLRSAVQRPLFMFAVPAGRGRQT